MLRAVAGIHRQPTGLRDAAPVLIDCRTTYCDGTMRLAGVEDALAIQRICRRGYASKRAVSRV